jgi:hypothetical protein
MLPNPLLIERLAQNKMHAVERQAAYAYVSRYARVSALRRGVAAGAGLLLAVAALTVLL